MDGVSHKLSRAWIAMFRSSYFDIFSFDLTLLVSCFGDLYEHVIVIVIVIIVIRAQIYDHALLPVS